jgi:hypothetical protein
LSLFFLSFFIFFVNAISASGPVDDGQDL